MPPGERRGLTRQQVLAAAVEIADADVLDALTMRKLAAALGVEAMSLYHYVESKAALLDGVLDTVVREVELPPATEPWDVQLRLLAHSFRRVGHRHPKILPLFAARAITSVDGFAPLERAYAILRQAGLDRDRALDAFLALASFVLGFAQTELGGLIQVTEGNAVDFLAVDPAEHPALIEMGGAFAAADPDRQFAFGLDLLIDGIRRLQTGAGSSTET